MATIENIANNIPWGQKIFLLLGIFALGIITIGVGSGFGIRYLADTFEGGVQRAKHGLDAAINARAATFDMDQALYRLISSSNSEDIRTAAISAIKSASLLDESLQNLAIALPDNAMVTDLSQLNEKIKPGRMEVIKAGKVNEDEQALVHLHEISSSIERIDELSRKILEGEQRYLEQLAHDNVARARSMIVTLGIFIAGVVITILFLAVFLKYLLTKPLQILEGTIERITTGDLSDQIAEPGKDEVGRTLSALSKTLDSLNNIVSAIRKQSDYVNLQAEEVEGIAQQITAVEGILRDAVQKVRDATETVSSASHETSLHLQTALSGTHATVDAVAANVAGMQNMIGNFDGYQARMAETMNVARELVNSVNVITTITSAISAISQQTNLLALNAAIEAARAGEAGRGFAVVADEVRKLAELTGNSTSEIDQIVRKVKDNVDHTINALDSVSSEAGANALNLRNYAHAINATKETAITMQQSMEAIAALAEKQHTAVDQITLSVDSLSDVTETTHKQAGALDRQSSDLRSASTDLKSIMSQFRLRH